MHTQFFRLAALAFLAVTTLVPAFSYAEEEDHDLEVAGWIPYWRDSEGIKDTKKHFKELDAVYPFAFTVTATGEIRDQAGLTEAEWKRFMKDARKRDVEVIPTVMWSDRESIHNVLSNDDLREEHIEEIAKMVKKGKYDGVGIDYEGKKADTRDHFSLFLEELKDELGSKILTCTIEARTPPESLYREGQVPAVIRYANDYDEIKEHCDRIEIMAYDQQRADLKLNREKAGSPYFPVADVDWVRKVVEFSIKDLPKEKVMLGIPTYGRHLAVTVAPNWFRDYRQLGAMNMPGFLDVAKEHKVKPSRNQAGEMSFTYLPKNSPIKLDDSIKIPKNTPKGNIIAARALAYANKTGKDVTFNLGWYSDAEAMKDKIDLAKEFGLRGVAIFKFDGEEDKKMWTYLKD